MSSFRIRPRFREITNLTETEIQSRIESEINKTDSLFSATFSPGFFIIEMADAETHYWSPQLNISLQQVDDGLILRGLYGPKPTIWALFFYIYAALGILAFFLGIYVLTRISLELETHLVWFFPVIGIIAIVIYFVAQFGQKIGSQQMFSLHQLFESVMKERIKII